MNHPTESDKATGQHLAKMVTAADTPNYRRVLADNERYLAVEVAALRNEARAPSSDAADKTRIAELEYALKQAVQNLTRFCKYRTECHAYDDDCGYPRRDFSSEDWEQLEYLIACAGEDARRALAGSSAPTAAKPAEVAS